MTHAARMNGRTAAAPGLAARAAGRSTVPAHRHLPFRGVPWNGAGWDGTALPPAPSGLDLGWGARTISGRPSSTLSCRPDTCHD